MSRMRRIAKRIAVVVIAGWVVVTLASFTFNLITDGAAARPRGLLMASGGGFDTRYLEWGTGGSPVVLVPGAFETADTFAALGAELGRDHRVYAIDLTGTGYSAPSPPYDASHEAAQLLAFLADKGLVGANAPLLVGHSAGAAVVGVAAAGGPRAASGVVFLDGDATPLSGGPGFFGWLFTNPYRTSVMRLALSSDWLIRTLYGRLCGPGCPALSPAGVETWRLPLQQSGFAGEIVYTMRHGITAMTDAQFAALRSSGVPARVIYGADDPEMSHADAVATAARIGAPAPQAVPGRHLTMISSPAQLDAALRAFIATLSQAS